MFNWIKKLFRRKPDVKILVMCSEKSELKISPDEIDHPDEMVREVIARSYNTGKIVIGNINEDGTYYIKELDR